MKMDYRKESVPKTDAYLLDIYIHKKDQYMPEALDQIEIILTERNIDFKKNETNAIINDEKISPDLSNKDITPKAEYVPDKKLFRKVMLIIFLIDIISMLAQAVYLEGKLTRDDKIPLLFHNIYCILGFPFVLLFNGIDNYLVLLIVLLTNSYLWVLLITYLIHKWREI